MNLKELIEQTAAQHHEFDLMLSENIEKQVQHYAITHSHLNEYEACTQVLSAMLTDSVGSLVESWVNR